MSPKILVFIVSAISLFVAGYFFGVGNIFDNKISPSINSFEECVAAGNPVMESYPEQCRTEDGRVFSRSIDNENKNDIGSKIDDNSNGGGIMCTADAKLCPDGSYVGRTGPRCEFAPCPSFVSGGGIRGNVLIGPTCPVVREGEECPDKPYKTSLVVTSQDGSKVITSFSSNDQGIFSVPVPSGTYMIRSAAAANVLPYCSTNEAVIVSAKKWSQITVYCDSGIR